MLNVAEAATVHMSAIGLDQSEQREAIIERAQTNKIIQYGFRWEARESFQRIK